MVSSKGFWNYLLKTAVLLYHKYGIERATKTLLNTYDFIVVGGGSAGAIVASKLSENSLVNVLLIEAGGSGSHITDIPFLSNGLAFDTNMSQHVHTTIQKSGVCNGQPCEFLDAHVLGGGSTHNGMVCARAHRQDFDEWAQYGIKGWSYDDVLPYMQQLETYEDQNVGIEDRGLSGPVHVTRQESYPYTDIRERWKSAAVEMGYELGDYNGPRQTYFADTQKAIRNGTRQSTDNVFLRPFMKKRSNLHVIMFSQVTRILFDKTKAIGVEYSRNGKLHQVHASKEVILSAGALTSPHLLLLSGIGDSKQLSKFKIKLVANVTGVGHNMQDQLLVILNLSLNQTFPGKPKITQDDYKLWKTMKKGILAAGNRCSTGYIKSRYSKNMNDSQVYYGLDIDRDKSNPNRMSIAMEVVNARVFSRGHIRLQSNDPFIRPMVNPRYLSDIKDEDNQIFGLKQLLKLMKAKAFKNLKPRLIIDSKANKCSKQFQLYSNAWFSCFIRVASHANQHQCCTCKMGSSVDSMAVVDHRLRVLNVQHLRVIDASVMPQVTRGNTNIPTMMIGLRGAEMIRQDWDL